MSQRREELADFDAYVRRASRDSGADFSAARVVVEDLGQLGDGVLAVFDGGARGGGERDLDERPLQVRVWLRATAP